MKRQVRYEFTREESVEAMYMIFGEGYSLSNGEILRKMDAKAVGKILAIPNADNLREIVTSDKDLDALLLEYLERTHHS